MHESITVKNFSDLYEGIEYVNKYAPVRREVVNWSYIDDQFFKYKNNRQHHKE